MDISVRFRKLKMAARLRGMLEVQLLLIPFIDDHLSAEDEPTMAQLERLLDLDDMDLVEVLVGRRPPPEGVSGEVVEAIRLNRRSTLS